MSVFEYKVVPAPKRGLKAKGVKGNEARFANALQTVMNEYGADGWEYQRTDTLPSEERSGLTGRATVYQNMLVFRRAVLAAVETNEASTAPFIAPIVMPEESTATPELTASREEAVEETLADDQPDGGEDLDGVVESVENEEKNVAAE